MIAQKIIQINSLLKLKPEELFVISVAFHFFLLSVITAFMVTIDGSFSKWNFLSWDAGWYFDIVKNGYVYNEGRQSNVAFFPLFPFLWKLTGANQITICIINFSFFIAGCLFLYKALKPDLKTFLLFLSFPTSFFFLVPYSESLFFLAASVMIWGFTKNNIRYISAGVLICCLTRSAASILVPALLLTMFYAMRTTKEYKYILAYSWYILLAIACVLFVVYIQYEQTGVMWAFTKVQQNWDHHLSLPTLPFKSWGYKNVLQLDSLALFIGILSATFVIKTFFDSYQGSKRVFRQEQIFSMLYLAGVTASIVLFWGGTLESLNRYVFATPFFILFLIELRKYTLFQKKTFIKILLLLLIFSVITNSLHSIKSFIYSIITIGYASIYLFLNKKESSGIVFFLLYTTNLFFQAFLLNRFLLSMWVG